MQKHIVIVEDDADQRENYKIALEQRGYLVTSLASKDEAQEFINKKSHIHSPAMFILDIIMQDNVDAGFQLCSILLTHYPKTPILFLTERIAEIDQMIGLRMGAWDYQPKPVSLDFLAEKVATLLRLAAIREEPISNKQKVVQAGDLRLFEETRLATWQHQTINAITLTEFRMLELLIRKPGHVITYDQLAKTTHQHYVSNNTVSTHIRNIKRKIKLLDSEFDHIQSEYGLGYRWSG